MIDNDGVHYFFYTLREVLLKSLRVGCALERRKITSDGLFGRCPGERDLFTICAICIAAKRVAQVMVSHNASAQMISE